MSLLQIFHVLSLDSILGALRTLTCMTRISPEVTRPLLGLALKLLHANLTGPIQVPRTGKVATAHVAGPPLLRSWPALFSPGPQSGGIGEDERIGENPRVPFLALLHHFVLHIHGALPVQPASQRGFDPGSKP